MSYFDLPQQTARKVAAALATICGILAVAGTSGGTGVLYLTEQRLLLAVGVFSGALLGWVIEHVTHRPVSRRALWPWGALGGAMVVLAAAAQSTTLLAHGSFIAATIVRAVLAVACVRFIIDAAAGPLVDDPLLAAPVLSTLPAWDDAQQWAPAVGIREAPSVKPEEPAAVPEPMVAAELTVVKRAPRKRKSGAARVSLEAAAAGTEPMPVPVAPRVVRRKSKPVEVMGPRTPTPAAITPIIPSTGVARFLE